MNKTQKKIESIMKRNAKEAHDKYAQYLGIPKLGIKSSSALLDFIEDAIMTTLVQLDQVFKPKEKK